MLLSGVIFAVIFTLLTNFICASLYLETRDPDRLPNMVFRVLLLIPPVSIMVTIVSVIGIVWEDIMNGMKNYFRK